MRNKPIKHATILALAGLSGVLFLQTSSRANTVLRGFDFFTTVPLTSFAGYNWQGVPLYTFNFSQFGGPSGDTNVSVGLTDTIMQRMGTSGNGQTVGLQMDALQFESTTPMFGPGVYGYITLDTNYISGGTVTINNNFTYETSFNVYYDLRIGSLDGTIYTSGEITDMEGSGTWQHDPTSGALTITNVNYRLDGTDINEDFWPVVPPINYITESAGTDESHMFIPTIPEPSGLALLSLGVLCLAIKTRRGRKQATQIR